MKTVSRITAKEAGKYHNGRINSMLKIIQQIRNLIKCSPRRLDTPVSLHGDEKIITDNWGIISDLGWGTKSIDYKKLGEALRLSYPSKIYELREFIRDKQKRLMDILDEYADKHGNRRTYWKIGDDGFSDLTSHIVGLGKGKYEEVFNNPAIAWTIAYKESFLYVFH